VILLAAIPISFKAGAELWLRFRGSQPIGTPNPTSGLRWLFLYLVNWIVYSLAFWMMVVSFSSNVSLIPVAAAFPAAYVLGYLMIFAPAVSVNSVKTYRFELKIWPCLNFFPGSTSSLPVPKIATRGFFDTLAFP